MSRVIKLTQGKETYVDDADYDVLSKHRWCYHGGYAVRGERREGVNKLVRMHNFLMGTPSGMVTDHIDGNRLNNVRSNLRVVTQAQNLMNRGANSNNTTGFKGVTKVGKYSRIKSKPYLAGIKVGRKRVNLGYFATPEEASAAYNKAAIRYHGEFSNVKG